MNMTELSFFPTGIGEIIRFKCTKNRYVRKDDSINADCEGVITVRMKDFKRNYPLFEWYQTVSCPKCGDKHRFAVSITHPW